MPGLLLNMIVKDESAIILRALESAAPYIEAWAITDTGSTDATPGLIQEFFQEREIPGLLSHEPFVNFAITRNRALAWARETAAKFDCDYILLLDADHELTAFPVDVELSDPGYSIVQKDEFLVYWNTRLVHVGAKGSDGELAHYVGSTHEYLDLANPPVRLGGAAIRDHCCGASRKEKLVRDERLLRAAVLGDPNDARSFFYLAQTLADMERREEAVATYRARIALGGWDEECFISQLRLARLLRDLGDERGFVYEMLRAWEMRPSRAEPMHDLATYFREHGSNHLGGLFAATGMSIPAPIDDSLFVEHPTYTWGLLRELSITGFYCGEQNRAIGRRAATALAALPMAPDWIRSEAGRNLRFYGAPHVSDLLTTWEARPLAWSHPLGPDWRATNPSIVAEASGYWCVARCVNYILHEPGRYEIKDPDNVVRTRNFLLRLDRDFQVVSAREVVPDYPALDGAIRGMEDMRLFWWRGRLWATSTVLDLNDEGRAEIVMSCLGVTGADEPSWFKIKCQEVDSPREKNWMPIIGSDAHFIYSMSPLRVINHEGETIYLGKTRFPFTPHGSTQVIPLDDRWWLYMLHEPGEPDQQRFCAIDRIAGEVRYTTPFHMQDNHTEFVVGMCRHVDDPDRLEVSFGVQDRAAWLATVSLREVMDKLDLDITTLSVSDAAD